MRAYKVKRYIQKTKKGVIDRKSSLRLAHELAFAAEAQKNRNILLDLRKAGVQVDIHALIEAAAECGRLMWNFRGKIAVVLPELNCETDIAERFKVCMEMQKFRYDQFSDRTLAIKWLAKEP